MTTPFSEIHGCVRRSFRMIKHEEWNRPPSARRTPKANRWRMPLIAAAWQATLRNHTAWIAAAFLGCSDSVGPVNLAACNQPGSGSWTHLGLGGQWVTELAETPWGLYAGTHDDGVFRRDTDGTWRSVGLDHAIVSDIVFVPGEIPRLLVGLYPYADERTQGAVFASADSGRSWAPWDGGLAASRDGYGSAFSLAIEAGNPSRLFMSFFDTIVRSEDGGSSWKYVVGEQRLIGGGSYWSIVISPARDGTVWAAGGTSLFSTILLRSRDWGNTWEYSSPDPRQGENAVEDNEILSLEVDPDSPARLFAGFQFGYVMRSDDGGNTWSHTLRTASHTGFVHVIKYVRGTVFVVASENLRPASDGSALSNLGLYCSSDDGETWETVSVPANVPGGHTLHADSQGRLLIGTRGGGVWRFQR